MKQKKRSKVRRILDGANTDRCMMKFRNQADLRKAGFEGFLPFSELGSPMKRRAIPCKAGVYFAIRNTSVEPQFIQPSPAGWCKGNDPTIAANRLEDAWVKDAIVLYIGKAGGTGQKATLRKRISAYIRHGFGRMASHWGGRAIWQIPDSHNLIVAWRIVNEMEPRSIEALMIERFVEIYGKRPFAKRVG